MKIAITSDTHLGNTKFSRMLEFAEELSVEKFDVLIHAGDIGESLIDISLINSCLKLLKPHACVLGNHDLWVSPNSEIDSLTLWDQILPTILKDSSCHYLESENLIINDTAIVGSYLHYNYSTQDPEGLAVKNIKSSNLSSDQYYARYKKRVNNDGNYLIGLPDDKSFAAQLNKNFEKRILEAEHDLDIKNIIIVTHVPCMECQITRHPWNLRWSLGTPYFGNILSENFIMELTKVRYVVSGHSHQGISKVITFNDGHKVPVFVIKSDYGNPGFITLEI